MATVRSCAGELRSNARVDWDSRSNVTLNIIDPTRDTRWDAFLGRHPAASVFHTPGWLEALRRTYSYQPIAFTSSAAGHPLADGIVCCGISNWLGARRLVSLPFSDHCAPLVEDAGQLTGLLDSLRRNLVEGKWKRVEICVTDSIVSSCERFEKSAVFFLHKLDLAPPIEEIFGNLHKDCVQRKIRRAEREELTYEEGTSEPLVGQFYRLLSMTRQRHGLPPQPLSWFRNLMACLGDRVKIRIALKNERPITGILTLQYKRTLVYKYGCSDEKFSHLGGMQSLLWKAIQDAKKAQLNELDLGRSECDNAGLVTFKDRWNATRSRLVYLQYPRPSVHSIRSTARNSISKRVFAWMPNGLRAATGRVLYKYMG